MVLNCTGNEVVRFEMEKSGEVIKRLLKAEGMSIGELADRIKISRQAMYKRLEGNMSSASFFECVKEVGYEIEFKKRE